MADNGAEGTQTSSGSDSGEGSQSDGAPGPSGVLVGEAGTGQGTGDSAADGTGADGTDGSLAGPSSGGNEGADGPSGEASGGGSSTDATDASGVAGDLSDLSDEGAGAPDSGSLGEAPAGPSWQHTAEEESPDTEVSFSEAPPSVTGFPKPAEPDASASEEHASADASGGGGGEEVTSAPPGDSLDSDADTSEASPVAGVGLSQSDGGGLASSAPSASEAGPATGGGDAPQPSEPDGTRGEPIANETGTMEMPSDEAAAPSQPDTNEEIAAGPPVSEPAPATDDGAAAPDIQQDQSSPADAAAAAPESADPEPEPDPAGAETGDAEQANSATPAPPAPEPDVVPEPQGAAPDEVQSPPEAPAQADASQPSDSDPQKGSEPEPAPPLTAGEFHQKMAALSDKNQAMQDFIRMREGDMTLESLTGKRADDAKVMMDMERRAGGDLPGFVEKNIEQRKANMEEVAAMQKELGAEIDSAHSDALIAGGILTGINTFETGIKAWGATGDGMGIVAEQTWSATQKGGEIVTKAYDALAKVDEMLGLSPSGQSGPSSASGGSSSGTQTVAADGTLGGGHSRGSVAGTNYGEPSAPPLSEQSDLSPISAGPSSGGQAAASDRPSGGQSKGAVMGSNGDQPSAPGEGSNTFKSLTDVPAQANESAGFVERVSKYQVTGNVHDLVPEEDEHSVRTSGDVADKAVGLTSKVFGDLSDKVVDLRKAQASGDQEAIDTAKAKVIQELGAAGTAGVKLTETIKSWNKGLSPVKQEDLRAAFQGAEIAGSARLAYKAAGTVLDTNKTLEERVKSTGEFTENFGRIFGEKGTKAGESGKAAIVASMKTYQAYQNGDTFEWAAGSLDVAGSAMKGGAAFMGDGMSKYRLETAAGAAQSLGKTLRSLGDIKKENISYRQNVATLEYRTVISAYESRDAVDRTFLQILNQSKKRRKVLNLP
ncbi:hypothetical protein [Rhizobium leguminosarum]|uniref:hypothetical protein n=1 Tax=Rhizobium leguminosarum TaxID=384 RepID=UPI0024B3BDB7|nr:hypothetical protein [Rhizobium leguminosarum]WHO82582.1 hypothetical protein QMO81_005451 [Rhizobium leguminosarum]